MRMFHTTWNSPVETQYQTAYWPHLLRVVLNTKFITKSINLSLVGGLAASKFCFCLNQLKKNLRGLTLGGKVSP